MPSSLCRSVLFVPGANPRALAKAASLDADRLVIDLEDSVAPEEKGHARQRVAEVIRARSLGHRPVAVRINALSSPWGLGDLQAVVAAGADAVLLPKVAVPDDVATAEQALAEARAPASLRLWIMVETAAALLGIDALTAEAARPGARFDTLALGINDIALETRVRPGADRAPLLSWLSGCVLAGRSHGLTVLDGVYNRLDDPEGFRRECEQGRDLGFDGKTLIHPDQIAAANAVFAPTSDELAWAEAVVAAFADPANRGKGVLRVNGQMVEGLHLTMARRVLGQAEAIAARNQAER